tara:strand:- start:19706 stop:20089 length:384 start_codon:yes stop_codon:yes gene_type:complete
MLDNISAFIDKLVGTGIGYLWFVLLAIWGGTVNYISRVKKGDPKKFSLVELVGEWSISGFVGVVTIYVCLELELSTYLTGALVAIAGHMGGRAIFCLEAWVLTKVPGLHAPTHSHSRSTDREDDDVQ